MTLLAVEGLAKRFGGVAALAGVSFGVEAGKKVALIGPNGAGKTTCFHLLSGLLRADAGRIAFAGEEIAGLAPEAIWARGIARTFQITAPFGSMTARENVQVALAGKAGRHRALLAPLRPWMRERADTLLASVGLGLAAERAASTLAYGDLKRLELAMALAGEPRLLLLDEPTAGVAAAERRAVMALVDRIVAERGIAVLFTEHDMDVVFGHADRIVVLNRGRVIGDGSPEAVRADASVREVYLGEPA